MFSDISKRESLYKESNKHPAGKIREPTCLIVLVKQKKLVLLQKLALLEFHSLTTGLVGGTPVSGSREKPTFNGDAADDDEDYRQIYIDNDDADQNHLIWPNLNFHNPYPNS